MHKGVFSMMTCYLVKVRQSDLVFRVQTGLFSTLGRTRKITSLHLQRLRFVPPRLAARHTYRQHFDQLIWIALPAELINENKCLANAKRPCDCSVPCLCPKSSPCSCPDCILDITSLGSTDSVRRASNNGVGQFKPIFQVEGNTFHPIFFGYFIADWLLYNSPDGRFHTTKLCSRLYSIEIEFYP